MERSEIRVGLPDCAALRAASSGLLGCYRTAAGREGTALVKQSPGRGTRPGLFCWAALGGTGGPPSEWPIPNHTCSWLLWLVLSQSQLAAGWAAKWDR